MSRKTAVLRWILRLFGSALLRLLTRTRITGREHLDTPGPVIYAANHASTFDALLFLTLLPPDVVFVGPGDFELLWPANWVVKNLDLILMKRGSVDRAGLKHMLDVLKAGGRLAMFPEGGTWEKAVDDVKSGVSYVSQAANAAIVPIGFGGTYQVWKAIFRLRWPVITVTIGPALPPVRVSDDRGRRQDELQAAALDLMRTIYNLLPAADQHRFDRIARQRFRGALVFRLPVDGRSSESMIFRLPGGPTDGFDALAELVSKPNLFSPLVYNARLPVRPFHRAGTYVRPEQMLRATGALQAAFAAGDYAGYLEYRMGEEKAAQVRAALTAIESQLAAAPGAEIDLSRARVAFVPIVTEHGDGHPPVG